jgi:hypothetical protein
VKQHGAILAGKAVRAAGSKDARALTPNQPQRWTWAQQIALSLKACRYCYRTTARNCQRPRPASPPVAC